MKKLVFALLGTLSGLVLLFSYRTSLGASVPEAASGGSAAKTTGESASGLKNGTFTGEAAQTRYGAVEVQIVVSGGKITSVTVPEYPSENGRDQEIANFSLPQLVSETTSAQSAKIDMVSGATYTSEGYLQSLQSALDAARA